MIVDHTAIKPVPKTVPTELSSLFDVFLFCDTLTEIAASLGRHFTVSDLALVEGNGKLHTTTSASDAFLTLCHAPEMHNRLTGIEDGHILSLGADIIAFRVHSATCHRDSIVMIAKGIGSPDDMREAVAVFAECLRIYCVTKRRLSARRALLWETGNALGVGIALCGPDCKVLDLSDMAAMIFEETGVQIINDRLHGLTMSEASQLISEGRPGKALLRKKDNTPVTLSLHPLTPFDKEGTEYLLLLRDPDRQPETDTDHIRELFGFTRAEANVVQALAGGETTAQYAARTGYRKSYADTLIKRALAKTEARDRVQLVQMVLTLDDRGDASKTLGCM